MELPFLTTAALAGAGGARLRLARDRRRRRRRARPCPSPRCCESRQVRACVLAVILTASTLAMLEPVVALWLASDIGLGPGRVGLLFGVGGRRVHRAPSNLRPARRSVGRQAADAHRPGRDARCGCRCWRARGASSRPWSLYVVHGGVDVAHRDAVAVVHGGRDVHGRGRAPSAWRTASTIFRGDWACSSAPRAGGFLFESLGLHAVDAPVVARW